MDQNEEVKRKSVERVMAYVGAKEGKRASKSDIKPKRRVL